MSQNFMDTLFYIQTLRGRQERERQAQIAAQMAPIQQTVDDVGQYGDKLQTENEQIAQTRGTLGDTRTYDDPRLAALADLGARQALQAREKAAMMRQQALDDAAAKQSGAVIQSRLDDPLARLVRNKTGFELDTPEFEKVYAQEQANAERQKLLAAAAGRSTYGVPAGTSVNMDLARAVAEGRVKMPEGRTLGLLGGKAFLDAVMASNPNFDANHFGARGALERSAAAGKDAQVGDSHNMLIQHVNEVIKAGERLNATSYPLVNKAINLYSTATGEDQVAVFNQAAKSASEEAERLFSGTGGSAEADRRAREALLDPSMSPEQRVNSAKELIKLASGRINALQNRQSRVLGEPMDIYTQESKDVLRSLGLQDSAAEPSSGASKGAANSARAAEIQARINRIEQILQQDGGQ